MIRDIVVFPAVFLSLKLKIGRLSHLANLVKIEVFSLNSKLLNTATEESLELLFPTKVNDLGALTGQIFDQN